MMESESAWTNIVYESIEDIDRLQGNEEKENAVVLVRSFWCPVLNYDILIIV